MSASSPNSKAFTFAPFLVGQTKAKESITRILESGRLSHAYLFAGPSGTGKLPAALAFAEAVNGVSHLSDLQTAKASTKSSWLHHPDIHVFIPVPSQVSFKDVQRRIEMLADDPYAVVDFGHVPELDGGDKSKNRRSFYPLDYYEKEIRPTAYLAPNEGRRTVIILSKVETMRKEVANAFLKLLEEPPEDVMFLLTTDQPERLLPTIISRCQLVPFVPVPPADIEHALVGNHGFDAAEAQYLSRVCGGNYAMTRFYDLDALRKQRQELVGFLRASYGVDAARVAQQAETWSKELNSDSISDLLDMMEILLRDIAVYRHSGNADMMINVDQIDVIARFSESLKSARLDDMVNEIADMKRHLIFNVNTRLLFIVLSNRFARLMRGFDTLIPETEPWRHIPQLV